jgi:hypothetical protein
MATTLAELQVQLDMESAKFRAELTKVQASVGKLHASVAKSGDGVKAAMQKVENSIQKSSERMHDALTKAFSFAAIAAAGQQLLAFAKRGADAADAMRDFSQSIGLPVEELSRLGYAAQLSGSSQEELQQGLTRLSAKLADAAGGSKEAAAVFAAMGVKTTDSAGRLRGAGAVLSEVADKFASYSDGTAKAALAQDLFGKTGARLIPLLNNGASGLKALGQEADRFGYTLSSEIAEGAARFNDALDKMQARSINTGAAIASALAPALEQLNKQLESGSTVGTLFQVVLKGIDNIGKDAAASIVNISAGIDQFGAVLRGTAEAVWGGLTRGAEGAKDASKEAMNEIRWITRQQRAALADIYGDPKSKEDFPLFALGKQKEAPRISKGGGDSAFKSALESLRTLREQYRQLANDTGITELEKLNDRLESDEKLKKQLALRFHGNALGLAEFIEEQRDFAREADARSEAQRQAAAANAVAMDAERAATERSTQAKHDYQAAVEGLMTPLERYRAELAEIERRQKAGEFDSERGDDLRASARQRLGFDDELKAAQAEQMSAMERYAAEIQRIDELERESGRTAQDTAALRRRAWRQAFGDLSEFGREGTALLDNVFDAFASNIQDGFGSAMKAVEQTFAQAILRMIAQAAAAKLASALFGDDKDSGILSIGFKALKSAITGRASGGPVQRARQYLVGEEGPELFVPDVSGRIVPAEQTAALMAGGGGVQRVEVVLPAAMSHMTIRDLIERQYASMMARR